MIPISFFLKKIILPILGLLPFHIYINQLLHFFQETVREFSPLKYTVIIDMVGFLSTSFLLIFYQLPFYFVLLLLLSIFLWAFLGMELLKY